MLKLSWQVDINVDWVKDFQGHNTDSGHSIQRESFCPVTHFRLWIMSVWQERRTMSVMAASCSNVNSSLGTLATLQRNQSKNPSWSRRPFIRSPQRNEPYAWILSEWQICVRSTSGMESGGSSCGINCESLTTADHGSVILSHSQREHRLSSLVSPSDILNGSDT